MSDVEFSPTDEDTERLAQYWAGELSQDERAEVEAWVVGGPGREVLVQQAAALWERTAHVPVSQGNAAAFSSRLGDAILSSHPHGRTKYKNSRTFWQKSVAGIAMATVLGAIGIFGWHTYSTNLLSIESVYRTATGQQATVTPDTGVTITMAPETQLRYIRSANNAATVELSGEAYFDIQHSARRRFTVTTHNAQVHVLGTAFNVQAYRTDSVTEIAVTEGKVSAGKTAPGTVLSQGMLARIGDSVIIMRHGAESSVAWRQGELVFRDTPVPAMLKTAGRWFGYEFRLADSTLAKRHVTTVLLTDRPSEAMTLIASVLNVHITLEGNIATLRPKAIPAERQRNVPAKTNTTIGSMILREAGK